MGSSRQAGRRLTAITVDQAVSSASNVLVTVLAARVLGVGSFGYFGIAFLVYVTVQGASRALVGEPLLVRPDETRARPGEALGTALLLGLGLGALTVVVGGLVHLAQAELGRALVVLGLCLPLLLVQDLGRYVAFATHRPVRALWLDLTWLLLLVVVVGWLVHTGSSSLPLFIGAWAGTGAVAGLVALAQHAGHRVVLGGAWLRETWPFSWRYLLSFGSMQSAAMGVSVALLALAGPRALGAVRGALLLLGPFVQLQAAVTAAGVAEVSRMAPGSAEVRRHALRSSTITACFAVVNGVVLVLLPDAVGEQVLGDTWYETEALVWPAAVQMVLLGLVSGPRSALLGLRAVRTTTPLDIGLAFVGLVATAVGAFVDGAVGAFWAVAVAQALIAVVWWLAFTSHHRQPRDDRRDAQPVPGAARPPTETTGQDPAPC